MSEVKREVWVLENANSAPCKTTLTRRGVESPTNKTYGNTVVRYVPESATQEWDGGWVTELAAWKRLASSIVEAEEAGDVTFRQCQWSSEWSAEFYRLARARGVEQLGEMAAELAKILDRLDHAETLHEDTMRFQFQYASEDLGAFLAQRRAELRAVFKLPAPPQPKETP